MQPALDSTTLDRLISLGRERGGLTTEDLRTSLPVETMSTEEIARIVVHLEETGIPVELEASLLSREAGAAPRKSAEIIPFPGPRANRKDSKPKPSQVARTAPSEPRQAAVEATPFSNWIIAAAGGVAFAVCSLVIFAING